ncbi:SulP family inorganic anion transporter [Caulobacter sp. S45]|uniref:SulP family inorganic anion transporter n=1 Tax=Caulobacter sp. S45 TaxID=1641861 RepID=UPI001C208940|nr:SulP family inorganic anion transporter [Caulobacter sp. S45]
MKLPKLFEGVRPITRETVARDGLAGVTIAAMSIPQVLGYARIAGMPLVSGLYTALLAPVAFAVFGSSRHLVVAADSATAAILAGSVSTMAAPGSPAYLSLITAVALLTGGFLLLARILKLGFLADFLSRTVLVGFLAGVGVQVGAAMVGDMIGVQTPARHTLVQVWQIGSGVQRLSVSTLALSVLVVSGILLGKRFAPRAPLALAFVVGTILVSHALNLAALGVAMLGPLQTGLPSFALPRVSWSEAIALLPVSASCVVVILAQSSATSRAFGERYGERVDEDADILGLAAANAVAAIGGAFVVNGSPTQTAMAERAGSRSQFAQLVFSLSVLVALLTVVGLLKDLPRCVLAAIIFTIGIGLVDIQTLRAMRRESPGEFMLALTTAAAVAGLGVEQGVLLAVLLSLLRHVRHSYKPHTAVLQHTLEAGWQEEPATPGVESAPGLIVYRFNADLFYANAFRFTDEVRRLVQAAPAPTRWLVVEADAITNLDYSAARTLETLLEDLKKRGVEIIFARVGPTLRADMDRHGVTAAVGAERIFTTRHEALRLAHDG